MIIAIPVNDKDSKEISKTFGRAKYFLLYDTLVKSTQYIDNEQNLNSMQGAGVQSAQGIIEKGAVALLTKHCGPKAYRALKAQGVKVYIVETDIVDEAIQLFNDNKLIESAASNVEGHWS